MSGTVRNPKDSLVRQNEVSEVPIVLNNRHVKEDTKIRILPPLFIPGYTYDDNSNITEISFAHRPINPDNQTYPTDLYDYDDLNRLTDATYLDNNTATADEPWESFSMDDLGNRTSVTMADAAQTTTTDTYSVDTLTNRYTAIGGPLAAWKMDDGSGTDVEDAAGSNDGSLNGTLTSPWITGKVNGGLELNGSDDYVSVASNSLLVMTDDHSYSVWINPDTVSGYQSIIARDTTNLWKMGLYLYNSTLKSHIYYYGTGSVNASAASSSGAISYGSWQHVAMVHKNGETRLFVDGVDVTNTDTDGVGTKTTYSSLGYYLGNASSGSTQEYFGGDMDEVRLFDFALTDAQVYALAQQSRTGSIIDYDEAGNMTSDADGYLYYYDYENRIISIRKGDGDATPTVVATFEYDALGRRIAKSAGGSSTLYYYNDRWQVLNEHNGTGFSNRYIYGNYIDEVLQMNNGSDDYYYAHSHLFSPTALIDSTGTVVERYEYDAYGKATVYTDDGTDNIWLTSDDTTASYSAIGNP